MERGNCLEKDGGQYVFDMSSLDCILVVLWTLHLKGLLGEIDVVSATSTSRAVSLTNN